MIQAIRRLLCRHMYADINLTSRFLGDNDDGGWTQEMNNYCVKCGKQYSVTIDFPPIGGRDDLLLVRIGEGQRRNRNR